MSDEFLFSKSMRWIGSAFCAALVCLHCQQLSLVGVVDFDSALHIRACFAAVFWSVLLSAILRPPIGFNFSLCVFAIGAVITAAAFFVEATYAFVVNGNLIPDLYWTNAAFAFSIPCYLGVKMVLYVSTRGKGRSVFKVIVEDPFYKFILSLLAAVGAGLGIWQGFSA